MIKYLSVILFLFLSVFVFAQSDTDYAEATKAKFSRSLGTSNIQFSEYHGFMDGIHPIDLYIGQTNKKYFAKVVYSNKKYVHFGPNDLTGDNFILREIDKNGIFQGEFALSRVGDKMTGDWNDYLHNPMYTVELFKGPKEVECKDLEYVKVLNGGAAFNDQDIVLSRKDDTVTLTLGSKENQLFCVNQQCTTFSSPILKGKHFSVYSDSVYYHESSDVYFNLNTALVPKYQYHKVCKDDMTNGNKISYEYVKTDNKKFNRFLRKNIELLSNEIVSMIKYEDNLRRFDSVVSTWVEVTYFDDKLISGLIFIQDNLESGVTTEPFIFDMVKEKEISQKSIFKKGINNAVGDQNLNKVVLTDKGFKFLGEFDPFYGQPSKIVAYPDLAKKIKNSSLKELAK